MAKLKAMVWAILGFLSLVAPQVPLNTNPVVPEKLAIQKANYAGLLATCLANDNCKTFLTWGFTDAHSWVPGFFQGSGAVLPFDADYAPKPAYEGMKLALTAPPPGTAPRSGRSNAHDTRSAGHAKGFVVYPAPQAGDAPGATPSDRNAGHDVGRGAARNALGRWLWF